jgi:hypothetical protein
MLLWQQTDRHRERDTTLFSGSDLWVLSLHSLFQALGSRVRTKETMVSVTMGESGLPYGVSSPHCLF